MLVIGLTGGIGSGKSSVADLFAKKGTPVIDADIIAREVVQAGMPALTEIAEVFGAEIIDNAGQLNRAALREIIFHNSGLREKLEHILHPRIRNEIATAVEKISAPYCLLVVPLLIDTGNWDAVDRILVVDTDENTQIGRVTKRDHQDREHVIAILDSQIGRHERLESADDVIENTGNLEELKTKVDEFHQFYMTLAENESEEGMTPPETLSKISGNEVGGIIYEQPLNERYRTFLKLESLFQRIQHHTQNNTKWDCYSLMAALIEVLNLTARGDLKSEIIKEIERQFASLKRHENLLAINQQRLTALLDQLAQLLDELHSLNHQPNEHLKTHPLLNIVRQRINIPGGASDFDIPAYCHWLNQPTEIRLAQYESWLAPFTVIEQAISKCLNIVRASTELEVETAEGGFYQQSLNNARDIQLIRVMTEHHRHYYPEISAGRHRFSIRFFDQTVFESKPQQCTENIPFSLAICGV